MLLSSNVLNGCKEDRLSRSIFAARKAKRGVFFDRPLCSADPSRISGMDVSQTWLRTISAYEVCMTVPLDLRTTLPFLPSRHKLS